MEIEAPQQSGEKGWRIIFEVNLPLLFLIYLLLNVLDGILRDQFILTDALYYQTLGEAQDFERIADWNQWRHDWGWSSYLAIPLGMFIRIFLAAMCLNIGSLFYGSKLPFGKFFRIATVAEGIFCLMVLFNTISFIVSHDGDAVDYSLNDIYLNHPASLLGLARVLFEGEAISAYYLAVLQAANLFEVFYLLSLALGMAALFQFRFGRGLRFVLASYGIGLLMWVVTLMFLMVTLVKVK